MLFLITLSIQFTPVVKITLGVLGGLAVIIYPMEQEKFRLTRMAKSGG
jgi:hypothetical protein